ncbi:hypothetical protein BDR05DRAFT_1062291 [Suillus weaverae]|nr:hypothetical protein BDR05DRAFT_1062291 [Suillus weaverae]
MGQTLAASDYEDGRLEDELITSFNKFGAQRSQKARVVLSSSSVNGKKPKTKAPGIARFIPDSAKASTDTAGSVGGPGTRDTINSGPQLSGIQFGNKEVKVDTTTTRRDRRPKALRALLSGDMDWAPQIDSIPVPPSETDALQQDVADLPDVATIDDYARVPITAFGAAMLRGMGWVDGGAVTSSERAKKNALVEPYLPKSRPALLGIGAKEQEALDDGSKKKKRRGDEKRSGGERDDGHERRRDDDCDKPRRESGRDRRRERDRDDRADRDRDDRRRRDDSKRDSDRDLDRRNRDRDVDKRRDRVRDYDDRDRRRDGESKQGGWDRRD